MIGLQALLLFLLCTITGCQTAPVSYKQPLVSDGEVYLYLQPLPQEAQRLSFKLASVAAIGETGVAIPLELSLTELKGATPPRQRFLASGKLPEGNYRGLAISIGGATMTSEDGEAALLVPKDPVAVAAPFTIQRKKAAFLSLLFKYDDSIGAGFGFSPTFAVFQAGKQVSGLVGYVSNSSSNTITVFDKQALQVTGVIATGREPKGLALDKARLRGYVALSGENAVDVFDISSGEILNRILLDPSDNPQELALTSDGKLLLATNSGSNTVSIIDPLGFFVKVRLQLSEGPEYMLVDPPGKRVFLFNSQASAISVLDLRTLSLTSAIATDPFPYMGQFNRQGTALYIVNHLNTYLTVIDPLSLTVINKFYLGMGIDSLKVDTMTDQVYAGKGQAAGVEVFEPFSFNAIDSIATSGGTQYMTIDGDQNNLYVLVPDRQSLNVINLVSRKTVAEIDVGMAPHRVTMIGER
jgi:YVTN family beta-propeller protein